MWARRTNAVEHLLGYLGDDLAIPTAAERFRGYREAQNLVTIGAIEALHPLASIGRLAAGRLFARLKGDESLPQVYTVPTRLLVRGSGELPRRKKRG